MAETNMMGERSDKEKALIGEQHLLHQIEMWWEKKGPLIGVATIVSVVSFLLTSWILAGRSWSLFIQYNLARVFDWLPYLGSTIFIFGGETSHNAQWVIFNFEKTYHAQFFLTLPVSLVASAASFYLLWKQWQKFTTAHGHEALKEKFIRGVRLIEQKELIQQVEQMWDKAKEQYAKDGRKLPNKYTFAGVPLPPGMAQRNILATGGMGSGKSAVIFDLMKQVADAGKTMIIYDKTGGFVERFYRPGIDIIFNPFDARFCSPGLGPDGKELPGSWSVFNEISHTYDFMQMAHYLMPGSEKGNDSSQYFENSGRTTVSCVKEVLLRRGQGTMAALRQVLFFSEIREMYELVKGTEAAKLINPDGKGNGADGIPATIQNALQVLKYIPDGDNFSLKEFIREGGDRRLFIVSKEEVHPILQPLTAMALNILYKTVMSQEEVPYDKYWFFIDEFASLGKLPVFKEAVTEARRYGAVSVVGAQSTLQFDQMFGKEMGQVIMANLQNYLILRVADAETQEAYSKKIGVGEVWERSEGISVGASTNKDGSSFNHARKERRAVLPSEIGMLADMQGFLKLAGDFNPAKVSYSYPNCPVVSEKIIWREGLSLDTIHEDQKNLPKVPDVAVMPDGSVVGSEGEASSGSSDSLFSALGLLEDSGTEAEPAPQDTEAESFEVDEDGVILNMPEEPAQVDDAPPEESPKRRKRLL